MSDNPYQATQFMAASSDGGAADPKLDRAASMLHQTKPWVRFISVMMLIGSAFMVLGGFVIIVGGAAGAIGASAILGVVYIVMALCYIIPAVFLWKYADGIALFVRERSTGALASALESQKSFWKFVGIFMLVVMAIYAVIIVFVIAASVLG